MTVKDTQAKEEAEAQVTKLFHALQMKEDDESENEETEERNDMQNSPACLVPRMPQHCTKKHFECKDSSVGSM